MGLQALGHLQAQPVDVVLLDVHLPDGNGLDDLPALRALMRLAIEELQRDFLTPEQVTASHQIMGLDTQLVKDRTYFMILDDGDLVGCGGHGVAVATK